MTNYHEQTVTLPDGRLIEVATVGDPYGQTAVFHHGTPGSTELVRLFGEPEGLLLVTTSRPGYGTSSRDEGRSVGSVVEDVRCVLDQLGRDRYVAVGWSGGGPHALACAALDAPRCVGAWSLAGVAPYDADFDWTDGMAAENLEEFALALAGGPPYEAFMAQAAEAFSVATPENIVSIFGGLLSAADQTALANDEAREALATACRRAFANGWYGFYDDDRAFFAAWGFDPCAITVPVQVWYGDEDMMVPPTHGAWLAKNVSTSVEVHHPREGHVSLVTNHRAELIAGFARAFA